ncbi:hypothetical protein F5051DRAFT_321344, partial [Lentinula edodes]
LHGSKSIPCAVIGFPLGENTTAVKVFEAQDTIFNGVREIDMVINIGALKSQSYITVFNDIHAVAEACHSSWKLYFSPTPRKIAGAFMAAEAGADFVKTCTGFGRGGATMEDVWLLYWAVEYTSGRNDGKGDKVKVKRWEYQHQHWQWLRC